MTVKTLRVILDREGDLDAEKGLVPFALNQRFILNNLMSFNGLMQDRRVVRMIDGSVITVKSTFGEDVVFISCPRIVKEVEEVIIEIVDVKVVIFANSSNSTWFFVWDLVTNDYAEGVTAQYDHIILKEEYPWDTQLLPDVLASWKLTRFSSMSGIASFVDSEFNLLIDDDTSFTGGKAKVGDYVYITSRPWIWSKIKTVTGGIITTVDPVLTLSGPWGYTISASLPLFYCSNHAYPIIPEFPIAEDPIVYSYYIEGNFGGNFNADYTAYTKQERTWYDFSTGEMLSTPGGNIASERRDTIFSGILNPLRSIDYSYFGYNRWYPLPQISSSGGDLVRPQGGLAVTTDTFNFQFYTYPGYDRNTSGQCVKRSSKISPPGVSRSSALEQAIKDLVSASVGSDDNDVVTVVGTLYDGNRSSYGGTMLQLINAARGSDNLKNDDILINACIALAVTNTASGISRHSIDTGNFNEVISVAPDSYSLSKVVQGWMASTLHATAIRGGAFGIDGTTKFGWAEGTYPESITEIIIQSGMYNNGDYTSSPTTVSIPEALRGHMKFYVVQVAK